MVTFNDADDFFETAAAGGNAMRFQDVSGIGSKTAKKIRQVRGVNNPSDVADMSADELSDKAKISRLRASKAIKAGGGNPNISKRSKNTGSVSAAGIKTRQGDFMVGFGDLDTARARNDARSRSKEAVRVDEQRRAPITTDVDTWKENPGEFDFPGVDTPTQEPKVLPKDHKKGAEFTTANFTESGNLEGDTGESETDLPVKKPSASGKEGFILDTGTDRILASEVAAKIPDLPGAAPGLAQEDLEKNPDTPSQTMGKRPSFTRLPEGERKNLASDLEADLAFDAAERDRLQSR